jgi:UDPglucose 6-dehydrogenase
MTLNIGYVGLSHLGFVSATSAALRGFSITGFATKLAIERVKDPFYLSAEPNLRESYERVRSKITLTADMSLIEECDIVYIAQDVQRRPDGGSDLCGIARLVKDVLEKTTADVPVVILSQVSPGFTRRLARHRPNLFYQVETLIFGDALRRATEPEQFILGTDHPNEILPPPLRTFLDGFGVPIITTSFETAELAKISINAVLSSQITMVNLLAKCCENLGANWSDIRRVLQNDYRIGRHAYLNPGLGISGPNLNRDLRTLSEIVVHDEGCSHYLSSLINLNRIRSKWSEEVFDNALASGVIPTRPKVAVVGVSYKEGTSDTFEAPAFALIEHVKRVAQVWWFDPDMPRDFMIRGTTRKEGLSELLSERDAVFVFKGTTPPLTARALEAGSSTSIILVDPLSVVVGPSNLSRKFRTFVMGAPSQG